MRLIVLEHFRKPGNAARSQGVYRTGADAVDADFLRTQIVGQIAGTGFERSLGHPHHIVMGHDLFSPIVCHGNNAAAFSHERRGAVSQGHQRVSAHIMRHAKGFARRVDELSFQRLSRCKRDRVQEQVQFSKPLPHFRKNPLDLLVARHITRQQERVSAEIAGQFLHVLLEPLALVGEGQFRARRCPGLRDGPRNGTFVGHTHNQPKFSFQKWRHSFQSFCYF